MRIKKGLPAGVMLVREGLIPLVEKITRMREEDIPEVEAFLDYLQKGTEQLYVQSQNEANPSKIYDFMDGGLGDDDSQE